MIKRIIYYGIVMLAVAAIISFASVYLFNNEIKSNGIGNNLTVEAHGFSYFPITYPNSSEMEVYVIADKPINVYILNATDYSRWSSYVHTANNPNGLAYAETLGLNSTRIYKNMPIVSAPLALIANSVNSSNKVYVVLDNTPGSNSTGSPVNASVEYSFITLTKGLVFEVAGTVIGLVLGIVGIIAILYGVLRKSDPTPTLDSSGRVQSTKEQRDKEYVDRLYRNVKKAKRRNADNE